MTEAHPSDSRFVLFDKQNPKGDHLVKHGANRGGRRTKEYRAWSHIRDRCEKPSNAYYHRYGGRGISVFPAWRESFSRFLADVGLAPTPAHSLDRVNNDGNYEPGNVRWATASEQTRNTSRNVLIGGLVLKDYCAREGLSYEAVQARLRRGHPREVALSRLMGGSYRALLREFSK